MMSFRNNRLQQLVLPMSTARLLSDIAQARGRQQEFMRQAALILNPLHQQALLQAAEAANRVEGMTVSPDRVELLVLRRARPENPAEQAVRGYGLALQEVHDRHARLGIKPEVIRRLHAICMAGSSDAGQFKRADEKAVQLVDGGPAVSRLRPVPAKAAAGAVGELCRLYEQAVQQDQLPPLIAVGALALDFLCIHPFRQGNGRVSFLLTLLALYHHEYEVGRYVSLERLIEQSKDDYHTSLQRSAQQWHEGRHDLIPWLEFFLRTVRSAYAEFDREAKKVCSLHGARTRLVKEAIASAPAEFSLTELERRCPNVNREMIRWVLRDLKARGQVECLGRGPGAKWRKKGSLTKKR